MSMSMIVKVRNDQVPTMSHLKAGQLAEITYTVDTDLLGKIVTRIDDSPTSMFLVLGESTRLPCSYDLPTRFLKSGDVLEVV